VRSPFGGSRDTGRGICAPRLGDALWSSGGSDEVGHQHIRMKSDRLRCRKRGGGVALVHCLTDEFAYHRPAGTVRCMNTPAAVLPISGADRARAHVDERATGAEPKIRVGISSCLLGAKVRYDGGHKYDAYINATLAQVFEFVPLCPETAIGLGTPREPIRLVGDPAGPRAVGVRDPTRDATNELTSYGREMGDRLREISGYIFKRASPSCGMERVKVYNDQGMPTAKGVGVYARAFMEARPLLPVEEEGRLGDPVLRDNFLERVFVYNRWQQLTAAKLTPRRLVDFHTEHKLLVMAHSQAAYRRLGRLVARAGQGEIEELGAAYVAELMRALKRRVSRGRHANILLHLLGYLKRMLDAADRAEMVSTIEAYRRGAVPLIVPITLLKHHFRRHPDPYIERQRYLNPDPRELMLRNLS
jgi:uncharacterized protein YbgA (DUF1722 family)/uncharacterized protein YbbK (DUF523 family)